MYLESNEKLISFVSTEVTPKRVIHMDNKVLNINFEVSRRVTQRLASMVMKIFLTEVLGYSGVSIIEKDDKFGLHETFERLNNATYAVLTHNSDKMYFIEDYILIVHGVPEVFGQSLK